MSHRRNARTESTPRATPRRDRRAPAPGLAWHVWAALALLVASGLFTLANRSESIALGYALERERQHAEALTEERDRLVLERRVVASPERLARRARTELGMRRATADDITFVDASSASRGATR